jgi:hypothetical protein
MHGRIRCRATGKKEKLGGRIILKRILRKECNDAMLCTGSSFQ